MLGASFVVRISENECSVSWSQVFRSTLALILISLKMTILIVTLDEIVSFDFIMLSGVYDTQVY